MQIAVYDTLPEEAIQIRKSVFVTEQGFYDEFDETDYNARHLVLLYDGIPAGTCRFFRDNATKEFMIGRLAVLRQYLGKALGTCLMERAEQEIRKTRDRIREPEQVMRTIPEIQEITEL